MREEGVPPSCCGLPSLLDLREGSHCSLCPFRARCMKLGHAMLKQIAAKKPAFVSHLHAFEVEVAAFEAKHPSVPVQIKGRQVTLTEQQVAIIDALPVKSAARVKALFGRGVDKVARDRLLRGENPFYDTPDDFLFCAAELLLLGKPFTNQQLRKHLIERRGWTDGTARPHVTLCRNIFPLLGLAEVDERWFKPVQAQQSRITT